MAEFNVIKGFSVAVFCFLKPQISIIPKIRTRKICYIHTSLNIFVERKFKQNQVLISFLFISFFIFKGEIFFAGTLRR